MVSTGFENEALTNGWCGRVPAENDGVLRYLGAGLEPHHVPVVPVPIDVDRSLLGAHPDVVEWVWDVLSTSLPEATARLVANRAALVHQRSGLIVAVALGTQYVIRPTASGLARAVAAGYGTRQTSSADDPALELERTLGPGWVFGRYDMREAKWLTTG